MTTKPKCEKCGDEMVYHSTLSGESEYMEWFTCNSCGHRAKEQENNTNMTIHKRHKKHEAKKFKRPADKSQPVLKMIIPKFQDNFYTIGITDGTTSYYNPISNTLRYEKQVDNEVQRNSLLSWITSRMLGMTEENES